mmetsp:Transcript_40788/g.127606  ORF Transcript_40788/g.127606 Transcript_40788/m.127606 type:complete len:244 (+) Transcript_40788:1499-2230(+)
MELDLRGPQDHLDWRGLPVALRRCQPVHRALPRVDERSRVVVVAWRHRWHHHLRWPHPLPPPARAWRSHLRDGRHPHPERRRGLFRRLRRRNSRHLGLLGNEAHGMLPAAGGYRRDARGKGVDPPDLYGQHVDDQVLPAHPAGAEPYGLQGRHPRRWPGLAHERALRHPEDSAAADHDRHSARHRSHRTVHAHGRPLLLLRQIPGQLLRHAGCHLGHDRRRCAVWVSRRGHVLRRQDLARSQG